MILVVIRMKVLSEKRMELSQTIGSLIGSIRTEKGCKRCDFCQSMENENELCLLEEWDTQEHLKSYLSSEGFRILRGALILLKEPYEMLCQTIFHTAGIEDEYPGLDDHAQKEKRYDDHGPKIGTKLPKNIPFRQ